MNFTRASLVEPDEKSLAPAIVIENSDQPLHQRRLLVTSRTPLPERTVRRPAEFSFPFRQTREMFCHQGHPLFCIGGKGGILAEYDRFTLYIPVRQARDFAVFVGGMLNGNKFDSTVSEVHWMMCIENPWQTQPTRFPDEPANSNFWKGCNEVMIAGLSQHGSLNSSRFGNSLSLDELLQKLNAISEANAYTIALAQVVRENACRDVN